MAEAFGAGLFLLYAVILFAQHRAPQMTDVANWTYQGVLLARHLQGFPDAAHVLKAYPVPNSAATLGIGFFALFTPWQVALKLWLCVQMGITFAAIRHLARAVGVTGAVWWIVPQTAFLGVNWWYGFINFELGLAWVLLTASMLLRRVQGGPGRDWLLGFVLVLAFFTHMIPFAFCGMLLALYAWQTGRWRVLWRLAPSMALSLWYLAGRFLQAGNADGQAGMVETVRDYSAAFWLYKANSYAKSFGFVNPTSYGGSIALAVMGRLVFVAFLLVSLGLAVLLGWLMVQKARKGLCKGSSERFIWVAILIFLPLFLFAPGTALGVSDPGSRLLQTVLVLGSFLVCRGLKWKLRAASVAGAMLTMAALLLFARVQLGSPVAEGFAALPRSVVQFAHVPFNDQNYFYGALEGGDYAQPVFPTGMFLTDECDRTDAPSPSASCARKHPADK